MILNNLKEETQYQILILNFLDPVCDHRLFTGELWHNFEILPRKCALDKGCVKFIFLVMCPFVLKMFSLLDTPWVTEVWTVLNSLVISVPCVCQWQHMICVSDISPFFLFMFVIQLSETIGLYQRKIICKTPIVMMAQRVLELATLLGYLFT